jgi:hypothetical protein
MASAPALADRVIERLWERMGEIYGHRWPSSYGDDPLTGAGRTWAKGLAGLSAEQIGDGVSACMASAEPWPPTLPEFRALCLGIPSLSTVRQELRPGAATRSRFALEVWSRIDSWRFRQANADEAGRLIRDAYETAREHVMRGGALPDLPIAELEGQAAAPPPRKASPEVVAQHVEQMMRLVGRPPVEVDDEVGEIDEGTPV